MTEFPYLKYAAKWRRRAEEMRTLSEGMTDPTTKGILLRLAFDYDGMAERADRQHKEWACPMTSRRGRSGRDAYANSRTLSKQAPACHFPQRPAMPLAPVKRDACSATAELLVEFPTKTMFSLNLKTATPTR
jgi:hypothetical protein